MYDAVDDSHGMSNIDESPVLATTTKKEETLDSNNQDDAIAWPETLSSTSTSVDTTIHPLEIQRPSEHDDDGLAQSYPVRQTARARKTSGLEVHYDDGFSILRSHLQFSLMPTSQPTLSAPSSTHTSSTSLHALSEEGEIDQEHLAALPRAASAVSSHCGSRNRRISNPKPSSASRSHTAYTSNSDFPVYPDQSFVVLQPQPRSTRPATLLRTHSSNPSQNSILTAMSSAAKSSRDRRSPSLGSKTADNTPISSPGLFSPSASRPATAAEYSAGLSHSGSPRLHPTHPQIGRAHV